VLRIRRWWCRPLRFEELIDRNGLRMLSRDRIEIDVECGLGSLESGEEPVNVY
jgi:hypothetical protein